MFEKGSKLSKYCGERYDLVQAGGGNISFKFKDFLLEADAPKDGLATGMSIEDIAKHD